MAKFRFIYTDFWSDQKVIEKFTPEDKLFMLYLLTNKYTKQIGVYRIPLKVIAFETGYSIESINSMMERFMNQYKLIAYDKETSEVAIKNWGKYNLNKGGTPIECCIKSEIEEVENKELLKFVYDGIKNEKLKEIFKEHISMINDTSHVTYHDTYDDTCSKSKEFFPQNNKLEYEPLPTTHTTIRGENEKEKENKKEYIKDIYSEQQHSSDETSETASAKDTMKVPYEEIIAQYNAICKSLPSVKARSKARDKSMKSLFNKLKSIKKIAELFQRVEASDFLTCRDGKWGSCGFDWIIKESNYLKILEGNYDSKTKVPEAGNYKEKPKLRFDNFQGRNYDYDSLEARLLGWDKGDLYE